MDSCLVYTRQLLWFCRYLDFAMNPSLIRQQDFFTVIGYISSNADANRHLWDWTRANYDDLVERSSITPSPTHQILVLRHPFF